MQLMTEELQKRFAEIGSQENVKDPIVIAKYFNPAGAGTWLATEYDPEEKIFFGFVQIFGDDCDEWGSFSLAELEDYKSPFNTKIERDLYIGEKKISEVMPKALSSK